ncbi:MAG: hypothetical protein JSR60_12880 [Proteobacteria bacterium]|nr:hypothetical protein [Pseudomonadota bacterium]
MQKGPETEDFSDEEATRRMEKAIRKALNTPRVPHAKPVKKRPAKGRAKQKSA